MMLFVLLCLHTTSSCSCQQLLKIKIKFALRYNPSRKVAELGSRNLAATKRAAMSERTNANSNENNDWQIIHGAKVSLTLFWLFVTPCDKISFPLRSPFHLRPVIYISNTKVKSPVDMPDDILKDSIIFSTEALYKCHDDDELNDALKTVKEHMDNKWEPNWHVVCGKNFGSLVTHAAKRFVYFYVNDRAIMIFKA